MSGETNQAPSLSTKRSDLIGLDALKKSLESESEAIISELTSVPPGGGQPIGIKTPLVDRNGYPRADIDLYRARALRKRLNEINTDHKELMKKINQGLTDVAALERSTQGQAIDDEEEIRARLAPKPKPKYDPITGKWVVKSWDGSVAGIKNGDKRSFDNLSVSSSAAITTNGDHSSAVQSEAAVPTRSMNVLNTQNVPHQQQRSEEPTVPFAVIDEVSPNSPAHNAGILEGDLLLRFGTITHENHRHFQAIAELVPLVASQSGTIPIAVKRKVVIGGEAEGIHLETIPMAVKTMELTPKPWSGRGLLGCHIQKLVGGT